jgi:pimeloyl-ACP methyl ester carboxylesterase
VRTSSAPESAPVVVLACDPPNVIEHYDALFELLGAEYRLVCLELPGFGFSRPSPGFRFGIDAYADVAEQVLDQLGVASGTWALSCVWSYVSLRVAARRPDLVQALILIQAPDWSQETAWARRIDTGGLMRTPFVGQAVMAVGSRAVARRWYASALPRGHAAATATAFTAPADQALRRGAAFCLASLTQSWFRAGDPLLPPVHKPAVVLWGGADRTHRHSTPDSALRYVPRGLVALDADAGHFPDLERPERLRDALATLGSGL